MLNLKKPFFVRFTFKDSYFFTNESSALNSFSGAGTRARVSFLIKLQASYCNFIKRETLALVFSCEFCEVFQNIFITEYLRVTPSPFSTRTTPGDFGILPLYNNCACNNLIKLTYSFNVKTVIHVTTGTSKMKYTNFCSI